MVQINQNKKGWWNAESNWNEKAKPSYDIAQDKYLQHATIISVNTFQNALKYSQNVKNKNPNALLGVLEWKLQNWTSSGALSYFYVTVAHDL